MTAADWLHLLAFQLSISLLAVGGAVTLAPDLHRHLVTGQGWLTEAQFNSSIAVAQVAPGPNVLFVALLGWNVGLGAAPAGASAFTAWLLGALGAAICLGGVLLPSSLLTLLAARWGQRHRDRLAVRAFRQGMAPLVVGLLLSTAWLLVRAAAPDGRDLLAWGLAALATIVVWRTRVHLLWLLALGALGGGMRAVLAA